MEDKEYIRLRKIAKKHEELVRYIKSLYRTVRDEKGLLPNIIKGNTPHGVLRKIIEYMEFIDG